METWVKCDEYERFTIWYNTKGGYYESFWNGDNPNSERVLKGNQTTTTLRGFALDE